MPPPSVEAPQLLPLVRVAEPVGADGKIQVDLPCRRCGYNVRSLARDARCPECGFPVVRCLRRDDLGYGDPQYVTRIAIGAYLLFAASLAGLVTIFLFGAFGSGGRLSAYALAALGGWLVTTPDPSGIGEAEFGRLRRTTRALLPVGLLIGPVLLVYRTTASGAVMELATMLMFVAYAVAFVAVLMLVRHLQCLAIRTGSADAVRELTRTFRGIALCVPPLAVVYMLKVKYGTLSSPAAIAVAVVASVAIMGIMFTAVATLFGTWTLARELRAEAAIARQLWPGGKGDGAG